MARATVKTVTQNKELAVGAPFGSFLTPRFFKVTSVWVQVPPSPLQYPTDTLKGVIIIASNQIQAIRDAAGDAVKEQKAYDAYVASMRAAGQTPKPLSELRR